LDGRLRGGGDDWTRKAARPRTTCRRNDSAARKSGGVINTQPRRWRCGTRCCCDEGNWVFWTDYLPDLPGPDRDVATVIFAHRADILARQNARTTAYNPLRLRPLRAWGGGGGGAGLIRLPLILKRPAFSGFPPMSKQSSYEGFVCWRAVGPARAPRTQRGSADSQVSACSPLPKARLCVLDALGWGVEVTGFVVTRMFRDKQQTGKDAWRSGVHCPSDRTVPDPAHALRQVSGFSPVSGEDRTNHHSDRLDLAKRSLVCGTPPAVCRRAKQGQVARVGGLHGLWQPRRSLAALPPWAFARVRARRALRGHPGQGASGIGLAGYLPGRQGPNKKRHAGGLVVVFVHDVLRSGHWDACLGRVFAIDQIK